MEKIYVLTKEEQDDPSEILAVSKDVEKLKSFITLPKNVKWKKERNSVYVANVTSLFGYSITMTKLIA